MVPIVVIYRDMLNQESRDHGMSSREMRRLRNKMNANGNAKSGVNTGRHALTYAYASCNACCVNRNGTRLNEMIPCGVINNSQQIFIEDDFMNLECGFFFPKIRDTLYMADAIHECTLHRCRRLETPDLKYVLFCIPLFPIYVWRYAW